jgi:hypothetical protein
MGKKCTWNSKKVPEAVLTVELGSPMSGFTLLALMAKLYVLRGFLAMVDSKFSV